MYAYMWSKTIISGIMSSKNSMSHPSFQSGPHTRQPSFQKMTIFFSETDDFGKNVMKFNEKPHMTRTHFYKVRATFLVISTNHRSLGSEILSPFVIFDRLILPCVKKSRLSSSTSALRKMACWPPKSIAFLPLRYSNRMCRFWGPLREVKMLPSFLHRKSPQNSQRATTLTIGTRSSTQCLIFQVHYLTLKIVLLNSPWSCSPDTCMVCQLDQFSKMAYLALYRKKQPRSQTASYLYSAAFSYST